VLSECLCYGARPQSQLISPASSGRTIAFVTIARGVITNNAAGYRAVRHVRHIAPPTGRVLDGPMPSGYCGRSHGSVPPGAGNLRLLEGTVQAKGYNHEASTSYAIKLLDAQRTIVLNTFPRYSAASATGLSVLIGDWIGDDFGVTRISSRRGAHAIVILFAIGFVPRSEIADGWRGITGSLLTASNFFAISTCSYLRPIPGVLWPVIESEIRSGTSRARSSDFGGNHSRGEPCPSRTGKGVVTQKSRDGGFAGVSQIHLSRQARWPPELRRKPRCLVSNNLSLETPCTDFSLMRAPG
jgi:hypothetical protein